MKKRYPNVFISHSHFDRQVATDLQKVLKKHSADTYLDQDKIQAGDILPKRIRAGITKCDTFLLIWSRNAKSSAWVEMEWDIACELRKKIVPYCLDDTHLPSELEDRVYVEREDKNHAHANLLQSIFGKDFEPASAQELFPGEWRAVLSTRFGQATYDIELRKNGQISGIGRIDQAGFFGEFENIFRQAGMLNPFASRVTIDGNWSYNDKAQLLTLEVTATMLGQSNHITVHIETSGRKAGALYGRDSQGASWSLRRVS